MFEIQGILVFSLLGSFTGTYAPALAHLARTNAKERINAVCLRALCAASLALMIYFTNKSIEYNVFSETYIYIVAFCLGASVTPRAEQLLKPLLKKALKYAGLL
ncbi:hypothetical protein [Paraglaciecola chathamensis]|uniref:Uncharacterized protein n=1 Tax=Paraglaciecola agarilytica NO2 TaxID=1125747 RepID=A0ABQ0I213_9ALTE|nr:hypothetical protein [Paraglaciecola agarilytica]GAC03353.1 hypothetical protein GAGA_0488 [Paraglaciecola agarilytica NO2]